MLYFPLIGRILVLKVVSDFRFGHWKRPFGKWGKITFQKVFFPHSHSLIYSTSIPEKFSNNSWKYGSNTPPVPGNLEIGWGYSSLFFVSYIDSDFRFNAPPMMSIFDVKERDFQVSQRAGSTCLTEIPPLRTEAAGASWGRKEAGRGFEHKPNLSGALRLFLV